MIVYFYEKNKKNYRKLKILYLTQSQIPSRCNSIHVMSLANELVKFEMIFHM